MALLSTPKSLGRRGKQGPCLESEGPFLTPVDFCNQGNRPVDCVVS